MFSILGNAPLSSYSMWMVSLPSSLPRRGLSAELFSVTGQSSPTPVTDNRKLFEVHFQILHICSLVKSIFTSPACENIAEQKNHFLTMIWSHETCIFLGSCIGLTTSFYDVQYHLPWVRRFCCYLMHKHTHTYTHTHTHTHTHTRAVFQSLSSCSSFRCPFSLCVKLANSSKLLCMCSRFASQLLKPPLVAFRTVFEIVFCLFTCSCALCLFFHLADTFSLHLLCCSH